MSLPSIVNKKRLVFLLMLSSLVLFLLVIRLGWIQIVKGEKYREMAQIQQTRDIPIPAKRGIIYDRNEKELAISASTYTVWARPAEVIKSSNKENVIEKLAEILQVDKDEIAKKVTKKNTSLIRVQKWIEKDVADAIRKEKLRGISIAEDNRRYYPFGNFAAQILGHTTIDNMGISGVELKYDKYLSGLPGRWIKNTDAAGRQLYSGVDKYYEAENGLNVVLTIDEVIQHFTEKALNNALSATNAKRVFGIVMDPKTGDILAMSVKPDYDPNNPRIPLDENLKREYDASDDNGKTKIWNKMWRNPLVSDTYEPGSTFKLITSAAGLEEGVVTPESSFHSPGYIIVAGQRLKCWRYYRPHGQETFKEAVQNSCNPVFVEVGQRLGIEKYYKYLDAFGFTSTTGVDLPGEGRSIVQNRNVIGPVELATMSYGQGISVTPLQLITAISAIGNDGKLMKPRIVKELIDDKKNVIHRYEPNMIRQVISEKTSKEMRDIMEGVVKDGSGKKAYIPGYRIGGKTGTADKVIDGRYAKGKTYSSFVSIAPVDDPQLAVLVIVDEPQGIRFGSLTAAPAAGEILRDSLRYLEIEPKFTEEENNKYKKVEVKVPEVRNMTLKEGTKLLSKLNLRYETDPMEVNNPEVNIIDQFPKPGTGVLENSQVILYLKD